MKFRPSHSNVLPLQPAHSQKPVRNRTHAIGVRIFNLICFPFFCAETPFTFKTRVPSSEQLIRSSYRAHTPTSRESKYSTSPSLLSYRSKSYHGDLNRLPPPTTLHDSIGSSRSYDHFSSHRDLSSSTYDLNGAFNASYVNSYSRHHSHHKVQPPQPPQLNNRNRFRARMIRPIRSRSANPPERYRSSAARDYTPSPFTASSHSDFTRKPIFSTKLTERTATENSSIKLMCNVLGVDSHVRWLKNRRELAQSPRHRHIYRDGLATLEIFSAKVDDSAEYTCIARNRFGENASSSRLKVFSDTAAGKRPQPPIFTRTIRGKVFIRICAEHKNKNNFNNLTEPAEGIKSFAHFMSHLSFLCNLFFCLILSSSHSRIQFSVI